jgi:hypothetical protein
MSELTMRFGDEWSRIDIDADSKKQLLKNTIMQCQMSVNNLD